MDEEEIQDLLDSMEESAKEGADAGKGGNSKKDSDKEMTLDECKKAKKTWMYIGIGASIAFAAALIWALTK